MNRVTPILFGILVLGAALRIPGLDRESFWLDEAIATNAPRATGEAPEPIAL